MHLSEPNAGDSFLQDLTDDVLGLAGEFVRSGGVRVLVKTNLGPAIPIFSGTGGEGGGLADALGLKAGVIVTNADGKVLQTIGNPPPTEPLKVVLLAAVVGLIGLVIIRGVLPK